MEFLVHLFNKMPLGEVPAKKCQIVKFIWRHRLLFASLRGLVVTVVVPVLPMVFFYWRSQGLTSTIIHATHPFMLLHKCIQYKVRVTLKIGKLRRKWVKSHIWKYFPRNMSLPTFFLFMLLHVVLGLCFVEVYFKTPI